MKASLRELLRDIVDYAGLFPPARLEMDPAIRNYASYRTQPEAWMLGRFICPAAKLAALEAYDRQLFQVGGPFEFSVLGTGAAGAEAFLKALDGDLKAMGNSVERHEGRVALDVFEIKLPEDVLKTRDSGAICGLFERVDGAFEQGGFDGAARFYEPALAGDWRATVLSVVEAMTVHNNSLRGARRNRDDDADAGGTSFVLAPPWRTGFKLRTGGLEPAAFPSSEIVACVIEQCRDHNLPLKFTAGLHHPIRRFDPSVRTIMHGFLNLFVASVLAHSVALELHDIQAIVDETDPRAFEFTDESIRWNDAEAMLDEIRFVRTDRCLSFGSCSFDEPRDDLTELRLM